MEDSETDRDLLQEDPLEAIDLQWIEAIEAMGEDREECQPTEMEEVIVEAVAAVVKSPAGTVDSLDISLESALSQKGRRETTGEIIIQQRGKGSTTKLRVDHSEAMWQDPIGIIPLLILGDRLL